VTDKFLVIGYGNALRRDDGAGPRVARLVAALRRPGVQALALHQLAPELADEIAGAEFAVFVDACTGEEVTARPIGASSGGVSGHTSDPCGVLGLVQALYDKQPAAWLVTVPITDQGFGTGFSPVAKRGIRRALAEVLRLIGGADSGVREEGRRCAAAFPAE
jgi:hydrogenase maturation protease